MLKSKTLITLTFAAMLAASTQGFSQTQPDPHHPADGAGTTETVPGNQDQQGMSMPMMMNMMSGMMKMMGGGGAQMGMGGMNMTEHTAGRIAFLRAELQITDAQSKVWDAFADAMQKIGSQMKEADMPLMTEASAPQLLARLDSQERMLTARLEGVRAMKAADMPMMAEASAPQLLARLDSQERMLMARLEGVRTMKTAFAPLYDALSAEQRKTADALLANHMGLMPLGMMQSGMMQTGMMPAQ